MNPFAERVIRLYSDRFGIAPRGLARAPGRVNLLGEHVDYNDGFVLPAAIEQATFLAFGPSAGEQTTVVAADMGGEASFTLQSIPGKTDSFGNPLPDWSLYPAGVAWSLAEAGQKTPPLQAVFASSVPRGAGLSSSASVEMAFAVTCQAMAGGSLPPMELARLCQRAENQYVGMKCGIMDQFASACGKRDCALLLDCRSLEWQTLPLPKETVLVVADTGVRHALVESGYNDRRASCEETVRILQGPMPGIRALRDVSPEDFRKYAHLLPEATARRARYIVEEIERMRAAPDLLRGGKVGEFGGLMNECHAGLRDLYEVSCPELDAMVDVAQSLPGCYGARLTGAGFGGSTINLVEEKAAQDFIAALGRGYRQRTGRDAEILLCHASDGAGLID
jgi:galactokinase